MIIADNTKRVWDLNPGDTISINGCSFTVAFTDESSDGRVNIANYLSDTITLPGDMFVDLYQTCQFCGNSGNTPNFINRHTCN